MNKDRMTKMQKLTDVKTITPQSAYPFFNCVVSNPPYQLARVDGNGAISIYHNFMNVAELVSEHISMIYPARWINSASGEGLAEFRERELKSLHYRTFIIEQGESTVFEDMTIKGGVNYFHWTKETRKDTETLSYFFNGIHEQRESLLDSMPVIILNPIYRGIVKKVNTQQHITPKGASYYNSEFSRPSFQEHVKNEYEEHMGKKDKQGEDSHLTLIFSGKGGGVKRLPILPKHTDKPTDGYKVFVGSTADPDKTKTKLRRPARIFIGNPGDVVSSSFIEAGSFDTLEEAQRCLYYLKTDFAMFLFGVITPTQHALGKVYKLIPDVDFSTGVVLDKQDGAKNKDSYTLDFTNIESLDDQLFRMYDFSDEEICLIQSSLKPWKGKFSLDADAFF